jgi:hypothetical protein
MCDFHSCVIFRDGQLSHLPTNSHSGIVEASGRRENQPNRDRFFWEWEWDGIGAVPSIQKLLSDSESAPQNVIRKALDHAKYLSEALTEGKHFQPGGYFSDTKIWCDVWNQAMRDGQVLTLPSVFHGYLDVSGEAKLDAPALTEVGGYLAVSGEAKLDALTKVGGNLAVSGEAKLDAPALTEVGGYLDVSGEAKLDAPALKSVNGKSYKSK